ncbi:MAG: YggT family protein [Spirochaetes bacterium]|nr:YggT family protein [Spirochaetota bacterium]
MKILFQILFTILIFYFFAYIARLILSIFKFRQNSFTILLCKITDPLINYFKLKFPLKVGPYEISSILPVILIYFLLKFLSDMSNEYTIGLNYLIYFSLYFIFIFYIIFHFIAITFIILIMLSNNRVFPFNSILINFAKTKFQPILTFMRKNIKFQFLNTENRYYAVLLIFFIFTLIFGHMILNYFIFIYEAKVSGRIVDIKT